MPFTSSRRTRTEMRSSIWDMLSTIRDRVKTLIDEGRSEEDIVGATPSADFDEIWGKGFTNGEQFVRIVVSSIAD